VRGKGASNFLKEEKEIGKARAIGRGGRSWGGWGGGFFWGLGGWGGGGGVLEGGNTTSILNSRRLMVGESWLFDCAPHKERGGRGGKKNKQPFCPGGRSSKKKNNTKTQNKKKKKNTTQPSNPQKHPNPERDL